MPYQVAFSGSTKTDSPIPIDSRIDCQHWFERCVKRPSEMIEFCPPPVNGNPREVIRFEITKHHLLCTVGSWVVAKVPIRVARPIDCWPLLWGHESAYNQLFGSLSGARNLDAIYLDSISEGSSLWPYLHGSSVIRNTFHLHIQRGRHFLIRLHDSFEGYMKRFSAKTRRNRLREIKILRRQGDLTLTRVRKVAEIDPFLDAAYSISEKTRKFKRYGWCIASRDRELLRREMEHLAESGSLRSYLLTCRQEPCAFILGQQSHSYFHPIASGVHPTWMCYGAGTVLLFFVLQDLFEYDSPSFYDLGICAGDREYLATDSYLDASVWLFRKQTCPGLASSIYRVCMLASRFGGSILRRLGLRAQVAQLIRRIDDYLNP